MAESCESEGPGSNIPGYPSRTLPVRLAHALASSVPGYKGSLTRCKLELYSEGEYVVDTGDSPGNFFYNWSELILAPVDWLRFGMVTQRTRAYHTDRDIQRGLLVGLSYKRLSFTTYVFNPDESRPVVVLALGVSF